MLRNQHLFLIPDDAVVFRIVRQGPCVVHYEAENDISLIAAEGFSVDLKAV
ncbi:MAG: hypothetical protein JXQ82_06055 [Methanomicrobiaceae archaeon]|nr:hypothetical protein [Methanomicrobiaceae archaeon]